MPSSSSRSPVIRLHGYDILADVGVRPTAQVYKVRPKLHEDVPAYMDDEEPCYALKCIDLSEHSLPTEGKQRAVRETQALLKLQHTNIARYHKAFLSEGLLCVMSEFAEAGTLHHLIYTLKERGQRLSADLTWHLFIQICHGLKKLHDCSIIHRALKTRNLLLFPETLYAHPQLKYRCKLADLGIPELQRHLRLSTLSGSTLRYLAPEVLGKQPQDEKVDVWALGCVLYEMATLSHAFNSTSAIQRAEYAPLPESAPAELAALLPRLLHVDPAQRPSVAEILQLPAVRERISGMPSPLLLDSSEEVLPPLGGGGGSDDERRQRAPVQLGAGSHCWAKHGSDGIWHRGVVASLVDSDCYLVQFTERNSTDLVWCAPRPPALRAPRHRALRPTLTSPSALRSQVRRHTAAPALPARRRRRVGGGERADPRVWEGRHPTKGRRSAGRARAKALCPLVRHAVVARRLRQGRRGRGGRKLFGASEGGAARLDDGVRVGGGLGRRVALAVEERLARRLRGRTRRRIRVVDRRPAAQPRPGRRRRVRDAAAARRGRRRAAQRRQVVDVRGTVAAALRITIYVFVSHSRARATLDGVRSAMRRGSGIVSQWDSRRN